LRLHGPGLLALLLGPGLSHSESRAGVWRSRTADFGRYQVITCDGLFAREWTPSVSLLFLP
jgi:hypothetical protein